MKVGKVGKVAIGGRVGRVGIGGSIWTGWIGDSKTMEGGGEAQRGVREGKPKLFFSVVMGASRVVGKAGGRAVWTVGIEESQSADESEENGKVGTGLLRDTGTAEVLGSELRSRGDVVDGVAVMSVSSSGIGVEVGFSQKTHWRKIRMKMKCFIWKKVKLRV